MSEYQVWFKMWKEAECKYVRFSKVSADKFKYELWSIIDFNHFCIVQMYLKVDYAKTWITYVPMYFGSDVL